MRNSIAIPLPSDLPFDHHSATWQPSAMFKNKEGSYNFHTKHLLTKITPGLQAIALVSYSLTKRIHSYTNKRRCTDIVYLH